MRKKRVAEYVRASTDEQKKFGFTIRTQLQHLDEYIEAHDDLVLYDVYNDEGISADKLRKRTELQRLLNDIRAGKIDIVIFTKLDRWFRSVPKYYKIQEVLESHNVSWIATQEDYETETSAGKFKVNIMLAVAQQERDRGSERIKDVLDYKVKNGEAISPTHSLPFGFVTKSIKGVKKVVHEPDQEPIVHDLINYYFTFKSKRKAITYLMEKYGVYIDHRSVTNLFKNTMLYGEYRGISNYCTPYMTKKKWDELQYLVSKNVRKRKTNNTYLFGGLIKCPVCGHKNNRHLSGKTSVTKYKNNSWTVVNYKCNNHFTGKRDCSFNKHVNEVKIEEQILDNLKTFFNKRLFEYETNEAKHTPIPIDTESIEKEIARLNTMYQKGRIEEDAYDEEYEKLERKLQEANSKKEFRRDLKEVQEMLQGDVKSLYEKLTREERQAFWNSIIRDIFIDEKGTVTGLDFI